MLLKVKANVSVINRKLAKHKIKQVTEFIDKDEKEILEKILDEETQGGEEIPPEFEKQKMMVIEKHMMDSNRAMLFTHERCNLDNISLHESDNSDMIENKKRRLKETSNLLEQ